MRTYTLKIFLINVVMLCFLIYPNAVNSQAMDDLSSGNTQYTIAILPIKPPMYSIYNDNLNFVANELTNDLRKIKGLNTLNVLNSLRKLKPRQYERHLTSISQNYNASELPDPDDLSIIAHVLDADKIILVSGGFNVEKDMLKKKFLAYDATWVVPKYDYNVFVSMFDPLTGNLEWQQTFQTQFPFNDALLPTISMSSNPLFLKNFKQFSDEVALVVTESLQNYFYTTETSTVDVKLLKQKPEATDGALTTDGQPLYPEATQTPPSNVDTTSTTIPETQIEKPVMEEPAAEPVLPEPQPAAKTPQPVQPQPKTNEINTFTNNSFINIPDKSYKKYNSIDLKELKPAYEQELLDNYQNKMKNKY